MTITSLAVRELWISFRLLAIVGVLLLASLPVVLLPQIGTPSLSGAPADPLAWLAVALAIALSVLGATAAATLARERRRGSAGWMAVRAVPRPSIVLGWFVAMTLPMLLGLVPAAAVSWPAIGEEVVAQGSLAFAATIGAVAGTGVAAIALGLVLGAVLPPAAAAIASAAAIGGVLALSLFGSSALGPDAPALEGVRLLSTLDVASRPVADAARAAGITLGAAGALLLVAMAAFERSDL